MLPKFIAHFRQSVTTVKESYASTLCFRCFYAYIVQCQTQFIPPSNSPWPHLNQYLPRFCCWGATHWPGGVFWHLPVPGEAPGANTQRLVIPPPSSSWAGEREGIGTVISGPSVSSCSRQKKLSLTFTHLCHEKASRDPIECTLSASRIHIKDV